MTRERRDRIEEISKAINNLRCELVGLRFDEIHELPLITQKAKYELSCEHITEIKNATDLLFDSIMELGY